MADDKPIFRDTVPPFMLQAVLSVMAAPNTQCGVRRCRRQGRCLAINSCTGEPRCLPHFATLAGAELMVALWEADVWLIESLVVGIPQPFGEWPTETIGVRLAACRKLQTGIYPGPELSRFRRWWQDCRAAAIAAGWRIPRRSSAAPRWHGLEPPKPRYRAVDGALLQPPEMAQPSPEAAENARQTLDL
jgi:hypothetical protein